MRKFDKAQDILILTIVIIIFLFNVVFVRGQVNNKRKPFSISDNYYPTGWMGDGEFGEENIYLFNDLLDITRSDSHCIKIVYHKQGPKGWSGIYWQNHPNNWGNCPGDNFSKVGYTKLTFWAKGEKGGEVVKFKMGGINPAQYSHEELGLSPRVIWSQRYFINPYRLSGERPFWDSFKITIGYVLLQKEWKKYTFNLKNKDLSSVIGGFCCIIDSHGNRTSLLITIKTSEGKSETFWERSKKIIFYLDDIQLE